MLVAFLMYAAMILAVALIAWCWQPDEQDEPMEFSATYDALVHQRAQLDHIKRKSHAAERLIVAQNIAARLGPIHDPVEL